MTPCILIPHYNHSSQLVPVLEALARFELPCVVVDDGSEASERAAVAALVAERPWVTLVQRPANGGKGAAVKSGLHWCHQQDYSHALQVDADGQHNLDDIPRLLAKAQAQPEAVITGIPEYDESVPRHRYLARYLTHFWVWVETLSLELKDTMCGFRIYPLAATVEVLNGARLGDRMDFDPEILVRLYWHGVPVVQHPTRVIYPEEGRSHFRAFQDNWLISKMHTKLVFGMLWRAPGLLWRRTQRRRHWSRASERGAMWGLKTLLWLYRHGGRWLCKAFLPLLIGYFYLTGREARDASNGFLARVSARRPGHPQLSHPSGHWDSYRHFLNFGRAGLMKLDAWSGQLKLDQAQFPNRQMLIEQLESGQGAMMVTAHFGNIEIFRAAAESRYRKRINVLALTRHAAKFNAILSEINPESQVELIQVDTLGPETAILLQERVEQGELVIIAGDRTSASAYGRVHYADFLGEPAPFSIGPYVLAAVLNCPIYLMLAVPDQAGTPMLHLECLSDGIRGRRAERNEQISQCIERYVGRLEQLVLDHPLHWFNFYDFWLRDERGQVSKDSQ
ncbi:glycosyltransferase family 2 protein [Ferrimonas balearica]|uniref:glycosyltransferase family 2 protein n=1 Tax=Ferrimonas balearica TaxID=44012 RepID=UPI001C978A03|nr:glycosyltransferase family 2 protein [Ferrimonas balearica]MBY6224008.1 glycosyltransferase family 2 protein [Ferrimonas balearica]